MTIAGHHTIAELREWLAGLDYEIKRIDEEFKAFATHWWARDPATAASWALDWTALGGRFAAAHDSATTAIEHAKLVPLADSLLPAEDEWQRVHLAIAQSPGGPITRGDLKDLYDRLVTARGAPVDLSKMPQPTATDADLLVYSGADGVIHAGEGVIASIPKPKLDALAPTAGTKILMCGGILLGIALLVRSATR